MARRRPLSSPGPLASRGGPCLLALLPLLAACPPSYLDQATQARQAGDNVTAADFYTRAAAEVGCPERARLLLLRAEVQELDGAGASALESIDKAISNCPDYAEALWVRAQRRAEAGERDAAMEDARAIQDVHPEAAALYSELAMEAEVERQVRERSRDLVTSLRDALDLAAKDRPLKDADRAQLARQVPVPVTLGYHVRLSVEKPTRFAIEWEETRSYRGDPAEQGYVYVRSLDLPQIDRDLPLFFRLSLSNQRLPMRFSVGARGEVIDAAWLRDGPDRGMRPEMLRPEVEGMLKRRRVFDPGEEGTRAPGDSWRGEDVRIVDGTPVPVEFESRAVHWAETLGVRTLHVHSVLRGADYGAEEDAWIHPATAVEVRWERNARYSVATAQGRDPWVERLQGALVSISGIE